MRFARVDDEDIKRFKNYWVVRHTKTKFYYMCWYDPKSRQTCRRSLETTDLEEAFAKVRALEERGIVGDPGDALNSTPLRTVAELLDWHLPYTQRLASAETEGILIKRLKRRLGDRRIALLVQTDFDAFRDAVVAEGRTIGTVSRTLTILRSALTQAVKNRRLRRDDAPHVPEYANKNYQRSVPPKARIMTLAELAKLIDAVVDLHLLIFMIWLINTASRSGAILDLSPAQIDLERNRIALNPPGRIQTKKYRSVLPIPETLRPWCEDLPAGHLVTWRSRPIKEIDTAFIAACKRAGLPGHEGSYSVRHMLGRFMRQQRVPLEEIAVWLGHIQPLTSPETTLIYSPDSPEYLSNAKAAVEEFVRQLDALTQRSLLIPPWRAS
jgi:integrase